MASNSNNVRSLARGLKVLRYLNSVGTARAGEIASELELPRPTVYRLLHTLEEEGYVFLSSSDSRVRLTPLAAALGDNTANRSRLCQVAGPILAKFTDRHTWPVDLSIYEDSHMVIQETTHARSPLSVDKGMVGFPLPMLRSSAGRAYLAACDEGEREMIIELLRAESITEDLPFLSNQWLSEHLGIYARQGYATRGPRTFRPKTSSLAVAIRDGGKIAGCLSIIWVTKAMKTEDAVERYAADLRSCAAKISAELAANITQTEQ